MREHALDGDEALSLGDLHADAGVASVRLRVEGGKLLRREQDAVGIVQLVNESARGLFVKSRRVDGVDEAAGDDVEDLVEQASTLLALALLKYEASGHQRNQCEAEEHAFSGSGHTVYLIGEGVNLIRYARGGQCSQMTHKGHHRNIRPLRPPARRARSRRASRGSAAGRWHRAGGPAASSIS